MRRLCILISIKHEIFCFIYNQNQHFDVYRCYKQITNIFYVFRFFKKIQKNVKHCIQCQLTQIKRHFLYDKLNSIISSLTLFYIIIINFILILSNELNTLFIVICKYSKKKLIVEKNFTMFLNKQTHY